MPIQFSFDKMCLIKKIKIEDNLYITCTLKANWEAEKWIT
jgi:hypothetical protein